MTSALPILLMGLAGLLAGGTWTLYKQGAAKATIVITGLLAAVALVAGVLWLVPGGK